MRDPRLDTARRLLLLAANDTDLAAARIAIRGGLSILGERCDTCEGEGEGAAEHWDGVWVRPKCPTCSGTGDKPATGAREAPAQTWPQRVATARVDVAIGLIDGQDDPALLEQALDALSTLSGVTSPSTIFALQERIRRRLQEVAP